jgi:hypothetical protein
MYKQKYLKYKKKYLDLKGGHIISFYDKIDENIISNVPFDEYTNPYHPAFPMIEKELLYKEDIRGPMQVSNDNIKFMWVLDVNKVYLNEINNCKINPVFFPCRYFLILYSLPHIIELQCNTDHTSIFNKNFNVTIPCFFENANDFTLTATLFNTNLNLFNSIYSFKIKKAILPFILDWIKPKIIGKQIYLLPICRTDQYQIYFRNRSNNDTDKNFKIHMNIKLEKYFWVLQTLIENYDIDLISSFKIDIDFPNFTILNQFVNRSEIESKEEEQPINIAFYPLKDSSFDGNNIQQNVCNLINKLKELFPENLNLSSNLFPRFNFRISDCIYFAVGDSGDKFDNPCKYTAPIDYIEIQNTCNTMDKNKCDLTNIKTKKISNHELCTYDDETKTCKINDIKQHHLLNLKIFEGKNTREIYAMVGQTDIYDKLIQNKESIFNVSL